MQYARLTTPRRAISALATAILVAMVWNLTCSAYAHGVVTFRWGDKIVPVRSLPPDLKNALRERLGHDVAVGFHYHYFSLVEEHCHIWTWGGKFILYVGDKYWDFSEEDLRKLLGAEIYSSLSVSWTYRYPPCLIIVASIVVVVFVSNKISSRTRRRAENFLAAIEQDARYQQALQLYQQGLPEDRVPSFEDKQAAISVSIDYLVAQGVPRDQAAAGFSTLLRAVHFKESYDLRNQGVVHEHNKNWADAVDCYEMAALLQADWDPKDGALLMRCADRCRKKLGRTSF